MTDYKTVTRGEVTPAELFDLAHNMVERLDGLEWAFACLALITLQHIDAIGMPTDPEGYRDTLVTLQEWLSKYRRGQEEIERDRQFMDARE